MAIPYDEIVSGPVFHFLVGKEAKQMSIHSSLVAAQSPAMKALVSGQMEEAKSGTATWEDMEPDIFALFAQFVYTNDYPPFSYKSSQPITTPSWKHDWGDDYSDDGGDSSKKRKRLRPFRDVKYELPAVRGRKHVTKDNGGTVDRSNPSQYLAHAQLYVLADKYDITKLRLISIHKLHAQLGSSAPLKESRYNDIVELARYIYMNTANLSPPDPLRELINHFIATDGKGVASSEAFRDLVHEDGDFANDLINLVLERAK